MVWGTFFHVCLFDRGRGRGGRGEGGSRAIWAMPIHIEPTHSKRGFPELPTEIEPCMLADLNRANTACVKCSMENSMPFPLYLQWNFPIK